MDPTDIAYAGATRQAELIADGEVSAREVVEATLARIEAVDPLLNAYRVVFAERALLEADQADARRKASDRRPLLGVPVAIKDDTNMAGEISTAAPYVNISMIESLRRILLEPWINVELIFGTPIDSNGKNRRELARWVEHAIANALFLPVPHKTPGTPSGHPSESQ